MIPISDEPDNVKLGIGDCSNTGQMVFQTLHHLAAGLTNNVLIHSFESLEE
jgi:hypothetical protein